MEMSSKTVKHEVLIEQYLRSILDISVMFSHSLFKNEIPCL